MMGARGFFNNEKFNLFMGAGALGATFDDFSGDNIVHNDLDFIHGEVRLETGHSKLRQKKIQWYHIKFTEGVHDYG